MIQKTLTADKSEKSTSANQMGNDRIDAILLRLDRIRSENSLSTIVIGVAALEPNTGVSTIAGCLAVRAAEMQFGNILLVDGNFARARQHKNFKSKAKYGLADVLYRGVSVDEAIEETSVSGLSLMTAGSAVNPGGVNPDTANGLMHELRMSNQVIIFDLPPVRNTSQSFLLTKLTDGVVIVVDASKTGRNLARRATSLLNDWDVDVYGSILNRARRTLPKWIDRWL